MSDLRERLGAVLAEPTRIVGIGNPFRGDDGVGPWIADRLAAEGGLPDGVSVMNVEDVIENYAFPIAECDARNVLLVDCLQGEGLPRGAVVMGRLDELERAGAGFSTHKLALSASAGIFKAHGKETYLLGIVSGNTEFGTGIAGDTLACAGRVVDMLRTAGSGK